jgi:polynucleotide 5'-kinase involved in rRNA processing
MSSGSVFHYKLEEIPPEWKQLDLAGLSGTLMIVGPADVGKSTFSRYLFKRLCEIAPRVGYLDGDPGQSTLGPPGTMTLCIDLCGPVARSSSGSRRASGHL